ncbi:MAG: efflux transporter outer membrane subunit [Undibacterium sp.]|uniref:efflux transporter outer membrane subunit n=1 Tax=Undibacterium sp. TaxID=1914977 RepID=UPI002728C020|nr:efflux transporter outer membrane subunit [Undibacterium sp.]MDO8653551.1 efflux transporter outer membrane subunit [Undibacterium sp.]
MLYKIALSAMVLPLAACVSSLTPLPLLPDLTVPMTWSASAVAPASSLVNGSTNLGQWWQRFNDPLLDKLIGQALQANSTVAIAKTALLQSRALRDVAAASLFPRIDAAASAQRSKSGDASPSNSFHAGFDASWEPDVFGGNRSALQASEANTESSAANLAGVQVSIAAEVAVTYIQLRGTQARFAIAQENLNSQLETLQITNWRVQAGLLTSLEGEQARAASEQTRAQIPTLETNVAQLRHSLAVLCGQAPNALQTQLEIISPVPQPQADLVMSIPAETLRQRPDVHAAEYQISAAWSKVRQADAARYPSFQIGGSLGLQGLTIGTLANSASIVSAILANVSLPIFDAGASRAQVRYQQAAFEQARMSYQSTVLIALKEVEDALVALAGDRERLLRLGNAAEAAANAALMARQRYASGLVDFQTVLETQRTLFSTQDAVASTSTDLSADHVRLYKALGGGWQPDSVENTSVISQTH